MGCSTRGIEPTAGRWCAGGHAGACKRKKNTLFITINQTVDYMALGFRIFKRGVDITRGIGSVLLKGEPVLGPEIAQA